MLQQPASASYSLNEEDIGQYRGRNQREDPEWKNIWEDFHRGNSEYQTEGHKEAELLRVSVVKTDLNFI